VRDTDPAQGRTYGVSKKVKITRKWVDALKAARRRVREAQLRRERQADRERKRGRRG